MRFIGWPMPNGGKIAIFLEEAGTPYRIVPVDIGKGERFKPDPQALARQGMPAIIDDEPAEKGPPTSVFKSGAILQYFGEKTGKFLPQGFARTVQDDAVAVLADGQSRAGLRPRRSFRRLCGRQAALRDQALPRARPIGSIAVMDGRASPTASTWPAHLDRRHGVLSLDRALRALRPNFDEFPT